MDNSDLVMPDISSAEELDDTSSFMGMEIDPKNIFKRKQYFKIFMLERF